MERDIEDNKCSEFARFSGRFWHYSGKTADHPCSCVVLVESIRVYLNFFSSLSLGDLQQIIDHRVLCGIRHHKGVHVMTASGAKLARQGLYALACALDALPGAYSVEGASLYL